MREVQQTQPNAAGLLIFLLWAIWGSISDFLYKRRGGVRPTKKDRVYFGIALVLCAGLLVLAPSGKALADGTLLFGVLLFCLWELGRWRVRHRNKLPQDAAVK